MNAVSESVRAWHFCVYGCSTSCCDGHDEDGGGGRRRGRNFSNGLLVAGTTLKDFAIE